MEMAAHAVVYAEAGLCQTGEIVFLAQIGRIQDPRAAITEAALSKPLGAPSLTGAIINFPLNNEATATIELGGIHIAYIAVDEAHFHNSDASDYFRELCKRHRVSPPEAP